MLILSLSILIFIFVLNVVVGMYHGFGFRHYWFDETMHFLGGFFVAMFLSSFTHSWQIIFLGLAGISFLWELAEYLLVRIKALSKLYEKEFHTKPEYKFGDTMLDLFLNFIGAMIFILYFMP